MSYTKNVPQHIPQIHPSGSNIFYFCYYCSTSHLYSQGKQQSGDTAYERIMMIQSEPAGKCSCCQAQHTLTARKGMAARSDSEERPALTPADSEVSAKKVRCSKSRLCLPAVLDTPSASFPICTSLSLAFPCHMLSVFNGEASTDCFYEAGWY